MQALVLLLTLAVATVSGQQTPAAEPPKQAAKETKPEKGKKKIEVFALVGTVFSEQGFALRGAQITVRRAGEKKVRGRAQADRRGEYGVRLRDGGEYEVTVEAKGYETQARKFSAQLGASSSFVFKMQPASGGKP